MAKKKNEDVREQFWKSMEADGYSRPSAQPAVQTSAIDEFRKEFGIDQGVYSNNSTRRILNANSQNALIADWQNNGFKTQNIGAASIYNLKYRGMGYDDIQRAYKNRYISDNERDWLQRYMETDEGFHSGLTSAQLGELMAGVDDRYKTAQSGRSAAFDASRTWGNILAETMQNINNTGEWKPYYGDQRQAIEDYDKQLADLDARRGALTKAKTLADRREFVGNKYADYYAADLSGDSTDYAWMQEGADGKSAKDYNPLETFLRYRDADDSERLQNEYIRDIVGQGDVNRWGHLSDQERKIYNRIYQEQGWDAAMEYLDDMSPMLNQRGTAAENEAWAKQYHDASGWEQLGMQAATVPANVIGAPVAFASDAYGMVTGNFDPNSAAHRFQNYAGSVRGAEAQEIIDWWGAEHPIAGQIMANTFQALMSSADSALGAALMGEGYTWIMGSGVAASKAQEMYNEGYNNWQIGLGAMASGLIEVATERVSLGNYLDKLVKGDIYTMQQWAFETAMQALGEGSEELASDVANLIVDSMIQAGSDPEFLALMNNGYTDGEAAMELFKKRSIEAMWDAYGGIVSGGAMGGFAGGINLAGNTIEAKKFDNEFHFTNADRAGMLVDEALSTDSASDAYKAGKKARGKLNKGKGISANEAYQLAMLNEAEFANEEARGDDRDSTPPLTEPEKTVQDNAPQSEDPEAEAYDKYINQLLSGEEEAQEQPTDTREEQHEEHLNDKLDRLQAEMDEKDNAPAPQKTVTEDEAAPTTQGEKPQKPTQEQKQRAKEKEGALVEDREQTIQELSQKYGEQAKAMEHTYHPGQDAEQFDRAFELAYNWGKSGISQAYALGSKALDYLTKTQKEIAYAAGQAAARKAAAAQDAEVKASAVPNKKGWAKGAVKGLGVKIEDMKQAFNDPQGRSYKLLSTISEATGINIVLFNSEADENGNFTGAQGRFSRDENAIYIDINAGLNSIKDVSDLGKYVMMRTFSHEITHFSEKFAANEYDDLRSAVFDELERRGEDPHDLIEEKQAQNEKLSYDQASREVIAEAMTDILPDSHFMENLANKNKTVLQKIADGMKQFIQNVKSYFASLGGNPSREANALKDQLEDGVRYAESIVKKFDAAIEKAVENYQATLEGEAEVTAEDTVTNEAVEAAAEMAESNPAENDTIQGDSVLNNRTEETAEEEPAETAVEESKKDFTDEKYGFTIHDNTARGTIEISFNEKPDKDVLDILKQNKFRWSRANKVWYGKGNQEEMAESIRSAVDGTGGFSASAVKRMLNDPERESRVEKMLAQAEKVNEAFENAIGESENTTQEVTTNAETDVRGQEGSIETPREDYAGGVPESEQSGEGTARLLDEGEAQPVQQPAENAAAEPADGGRGQTGRSGSRADSERNERGRGTGSSESGDLRRDGNVTESQTETKQKKQEQKLRETVEQKVEQQSTETPRGSNYVIGDSLNLATGEKARYADNVAALKLIHQLNTEGRLATAQEQETLARYVGWGGLSNAFGDMSYNRETHKYEMVAKKGWENEFQALRQLIADGVITEDEYKGMSESTKNAHYTSMEVVKAMYDGLKGLGFQGGRMLEPSSGVGNFVGGMPGDMASTVKSWTMVELDRVTGQIAKYLYPNNDVRIQGFQDANIPDGYMDVAIGNVPFGNYGVADRSYPSRVTKSIHNYFFAKSLDKVRPGGIVMFITSSFTMNSENSAIRQYIADRADLLGAIRLPNTAFKGNAGTDVVTDIIVLKKRAPGTQYKGEAFLESPQKQIPGSWRMANVNEYFNAHPEMVLGTEAVTHGMYGADTLTYNPLENAGSLGDQIRKAFANISGKMEYNQQTAEQAQKAEEKAVRKKKEGRYQKDSDGTIRNTDGTAVTDTDAAKRIGGMIDIRDAYRNLIERIQQGRTAEQIAAARKNLNQVYDKFVQEYGYINDAKNRKAISEDVERFALYALETDYQAGGKGKSSTASKADIFTKDTIKPNVTANHADSVSDGMIVSINTTGGVDPALIAKLTGKTEDAVRRELIDGRMAFKTRDGHLEAPETYLSGNVRAKLREAEALAFTDKDFQNNVEELRRVVPKDIPYDEIYVSPGAVWVPTDVYADFIAGMLGGSNSSSYRGPDVQVGYSAQTGEFKIKLNNARLKGNYQNTQEWGTSRKNFLELMEALMGNGNVTVSDRVLDDNGNERREVNKDETAAAQEKADKIKAKFQEWIWSDEGRRNQLAKLYNETYNALANPKYDGSNLTVNGLNAMFNLREHQANAVKRIVASGGNTLLAHRVGAGKTLEMAAAAMKLRELGIVKKPVFAVPKNLVAQWGVEFRNYFPAANLLIADDKSFDKSNRKVFTNNIANGDFDAVIMSYEQFGKIPMSPTFQQRFVQEQIDEILNAIAEEKAENGKGSLTVKQMEKKVAQLKVKLDKLKIQRVDTDNVDFETLGIDSLFVDEAHNFKNLQYTTKMQNVGGLGNSDGSQRAFDLYTKIRYLQQMNGGKGIVFATATPVMNSMAEMYIMQKYLQSDMLKQLGITTFDAWAKQFGEVVNTYEIKPSGQGVRAKQVFSNFKNLNELQLMFRSFSDVMTEVPGLKIPKMRGGSVNIVECTPGKFQKDFMRSLEKRANNVRNVRPEVDNMLKITSDGRKVSYTQRMIDPSLPYEAGCKLYRCAENILKEYKSGTGKAVKDSKSGKNARINGTQIVFLDMATPKGTDKSKANADTSTETTDDVLDTESAKLYDDLRDYLVQKGIPKEEIAFIHEASSDAKRKQLFADMNSGKVRVLIGSTGKMGVGMNAQRCVTAIHHLDAPWRPGDVEQRDGRAFRQGNLNDEVAKYVYVTKGSFDARLWDILDRKSGFINQIMNGDDVGRNAEDTGDVTLSAAEVKALASGNPLIKESVELSDELQKLNGLKRTHDSAVTRARTKLMEDTQQIAAVQSTIQALDRDIKARTNTYSEETFSMEVGSKTFTDRREAGEALLRAILSKAKTENQFVDVGQFAGFAIMAAKSGSEYSGFLQGNMRHNFKIHLNNSTLMAGQMAKMIGGLENQLTQQKDLLSRTIADKAAQEVMIQQPFERQAELDQKRQRYDTVMAELNKTEQQFGSEDDQEQSRTSALTDRELLSVAANEVSKYNLSPAERDALGIYQNRLSDLEALENERTELGRQYKKQQFGANVDRKAAAETLNRMHILDGKIEKANEALLDVENKKILRNVLQQARKVAESQERAKGAEALRQFREKKANAEATRKYRARIVKDVSDMTKWVISPSGKDTLKHVPDVLKNSVIPFLASIDMSSNRSLRGGAATQADEVFMHQLKGLRNALNQNIDVNGMYSGYNDLPPDFMDNLNSLIDDASEIIRAANGEYILNRMSAAELKKLSTIVKDVKKFVKDFNRFHANAMFQHVSEAGDSTISELSSMAPAKHTGAASQFLMWQQMRPAYAFERFGAGGKAIYDGLRRGQAKLAFTTQKIIEFSESAYDTKEVREWEKELKTIQLDDGSEITLPVSSIMSFYELSKRPQALTHILGNGIRVSTFSNKESALKPAKKYSDAGHLITIDDVERIIDTLSDRQREVADKLQKYMAEEGGKLGNYVSVARFGEEMFGEEHYFPINSDGRHLDAKADESPESSSLYALLNMSFTKELTKKANNRIVLYSIFDVFSNHMASMAQYNAMALPVLDALKWFNYQQKSEPNENGVREVVGSVRDQMDRVYGVPDEKRPGSGKRGYAENFVINIIKAFNGTEAQGSPYDSVGMQYLHKFNRAQVAYNFRVVLQQPMAITRAAMVIGYDSILKGMKLSPKVIKANIAEMKENSGIAAWKDLGFYDVNISRGLTSMIKHDETLGDKVVEFGMSGAEAADTLTWGAMWAACKEEVKKKAKGTSLSNEELLKRTTDLFEEVVYKTQVVDSVLTKNEFMRDKGFFARSVGSFMGEPTTTASMLMNAIDKYEMDIQKGMTRKESLAKNGKLIFRTGVVYGVGAVLLAGVQAVADAMRDDDKYEDWPEKWKEAFTGNLIDEALPFNTLPIVSDFYELGKELLHQWGVDTYGNAPSSVYMQWYDSLVKGVSILHDKMTGKQTNYTNYAVVYKLLQAASGIGGVPMASLTRDVVTAWNNFIVPYAPSLGAKLIRTYENKPETEIKYAYLDGYLTDKEAIDYFMKDAGMTKDKAEARVAKLSLIRSNKKYQDVSDAAMEKYLEYAESTGLKIDDYLKAWEFQKDTKADVDKDGKTVSGSKKEKILKYINGMNITRAQKDSLYLAFGYTEKELSEAPWNK